MNARARADSSAWKWWVCGLLLCASAINYMDRQTLASASVRITKQFQLTNEQYGNLELGFGWAFAAGSLIFGVLVDRFPVRWVYPAALLLWSAMGFLTGLVESYSGLLTCRTLLGFFEAGHWPCAVKTTQRLLTPADRSMGNSLLQSGTSIGAVITPLIMSRLLTLELGSWRPAFQIVGAVGLVWIIAWFVMVRKTELIDALATVEMKRWSGLGEVLFSRRMLVVIVVIALINTSWQLLRAWLPKFLQEGRGYAESEALYFTSVFYVATDVGVLGAGALTLWLNRRGMSVFNARCIGFLCCAALAALAVFVMVLPKNSWLLLAVLLCVGAGALGVFGIYHAFTQDLTRTHQGMVTGVAGVAAWSLSPAQKYFGRLVDQTGSFDLGFAIAGCLPFVALICIWLFWNRKGDLPAAPE
jgi:ACS family hexuronate transporter-like MFS transporter